MFWKYTKDATIADLRKKIEELEKYQIQCETLEVKLEQKENKISQLQGELRYAEEELQVYKEHKESLEEDNEQLRNANSELSSQIKELSDNFTEVEALLKRSEESANQGNAEAYAKHLEQTNSLLETEKELNRQLQENMTKMSENQNRLNKRYSSLEAQLDEKRRELNEIVNEYSSLKETATELAAKNNNLEAAVNELENELAEKEQEQNEVIQQYRPPSPTNIQQIQQFDAGPPARNRARTSIVPPPTNQQQNGGIAPITPIDLEYTLIRQNTHGGYDSGDFSDAFDDIVDDDVESEKLEKWRRLRSSALEKRRQSKMMHSRNNSAYSGLNLYDSASNNRLGGGQMNANFEKMFQEMNEKMVKELGEQFVEFKKSMEYDFKEIKDLVVNIESGQGGGDGHRDSIEDAREQLKWTQDALTAPSIQDQLSNIEKVQKEHSEHVRNQTTELIEDFQNEMDDKSAKMDELMSLMSAQLVETEHQTQDYLDKKMEQLFDNLKQELNGNSKNSKRQGMETIEEEDTKSGEILNKNAVENLVNQFSSLIDTKINEQNKNIMDNNEYNKTQLYNAIDAVSKTLSNFANYFNITGDGSDNNHNNNNNNNNGVTFFSKIGEMLSQTQSAIVNQTTSTIENNNATNHENILREFEEKLDVESSITPANNDLLDTIVSDKVKTVEILGKQMDILREQIKFAHKQNTTLSDIAKRQQSSLHQAQNQGYVLMHFCSLCLCFGMFSIFDFFFFFFFLYFIF